MPTLGGLLRFADPSPPIVVTGNIASSMLTAADPHSTQHILEVASTFCILGPKYILAGQRNLKVYFGVETPATFLSWYRQAVLMSIT